MKPRYTKPQARDLGGYRSMLASGQWDGGPPMPPMPGGPGGDELNICINGSTAKGSHLANCVSGLNASGGSCVIGPTVIGCSVGTRPDSFECITGGRVGLSDPCNTGTAGASWVGCNAGTNVLPSP